MKRGHFLYIFNMETGERGRKVDISEKREMEIITLEAKMRAELVEPWTVRDSRNDDQSGNDAR